MQATDIKKIVVIGPESTGKSTLCQQLAAHFKSTWCAEYAREYLLKHGMDYSFDDLLTIAKGQIALEEQAEQQAKAAGHSMLFIDTDMYVMKVWCEFVFGKVHPFVIDQISKRKYDLYLLCSPDLPWVKDELREYPDVERRQQLFQIYKQIMMSQQVSWYEIDGSYEHRLKKAIVAVETSLQLPPREGALDNLAS